MLKELYYRIKYRSFLASASGKRLFADLAMGSLVQEGTALKRGCLKRLGVLDEKVGRMTFVSDGKVSRKLDDFGETKNGQTGAAPLTPEERATIKRRRAMNLYLVLGMLTVEVFLNYLSMLLIISGRSPFLVTARVALAIGATAIPFLAIHKTFEAADDRSRGDGGWFRVVFAAFLSLLLLVALFALASARARDFEGSGGGIIYYGFIILTVVFPVVAGWFWFDREQVMAKYVRRTQWLHARREQERLGEEIGALGIRGRALKAEAVEAIRSMIYGYWSAFVFFSALKDRLDLKRGRPIEEASGFGESEETFALESWRRLGLERDSFEPHGGG